MEGECHSLTPTAVLPCKIVNETRRRPRWLMRRQNLAEYQMLLDYCPHLITFDDRSLVCCTATQIHRLTRQLELAAQLFSRCPSCNDNFNRLWCQFTCSPSQANFVEIVATGPNSSVTSTRYHVTERFLDGLYDSCKNVKFGNRPALRLMTSSSSPSSEVVTQSQWIDFMSMKSLKNGIPMTTEFVLGSPGDGFMDIDFSKCNQPLGPNQPACSHLDCHFDSRKNRKIKKFNKKMSEFVIDFDLPSIDWLIRILCCCIFTSLVVVAIKFSCQRPTIKEEILDDHFNSVCILDDNEQIEILFESTCKWYANTVIKYPFKCIGTGLLIATVCLMGNYRFISLSYSIDRLASIDSIAIEQQQKFLNYFGPLHRIEQIIVRVGCDDDDKTSLNNDTNKYHGQIFEKEIFIEIFELIDKVKNLKVSWNNSNVTLDNICWRPMGETGECAILSPTNYFQNKIERFENAEIIDDFNFDEIEAYWSHLEECIKMPMTLTTNIGLSCFGEFGGPVEPQLIFGSEKNSKMKSVENYFFTSSILITIPVNGDQAEKARAWEIGFIEMMKNHKSNRSIITFSSESSISEELIQEANKDKWVSILACALVLVWLFTMLGNYYWPEKSILSIFVHQKFTIAFLTVFLSVVSSWCSIGVFSFFDIHATDNAIVVLFFIVTCIGINRSFIIIRAFQSDENCFGSPKMSINEMNERIVAVMSLTIPIVLTSSLICALCFVLTGGTPIIGVKMPAIETFARHAGLAIFVDLLFFMLILLPIFKYDAIRQLKGKAEIFSCYQLSDNSKIVLQNSGERTVGLVSPVEILKTNVAPWLMRSNVRLATYLIFLASLSSSIYCSFKLKYGFDQTMLFSKNGYLSKHFETMNNVVGIGPPVYFVIEGDVDWADVQVQNKFCSLPGCDEMSMGMIIRDLASESDATGMTPTSFLTGDVFVWIDTYLQFLNPKGKCCRKMENGTICISLNNNSTNCKKTCIYSRNENRKTRPNRMEFYKYLKHFLDFQPSVECASGGRATAKNAVSFNDESGNIKATYFWTFFKKLNISSSLELYTAMSYARFVATEIERRIGIDGVHIFAYSQFFPYFEPYFSIGQTLYTLAVLVLFVVFVTILLFLKVSVREALVTVFVLLSSFIHLMSWMYLMRIEMNVVSATNIAMSLGISVEFVIQVLYGYCNSKQLKSVDRASTAITKNGSTIISGILPAILLTAAALGVAESQILRVYFCFQLFGVGLVSTIHGVVYLPAMLALVGKDRYLEVLTVEETVATSPQSTEL